MSVPFRIRRAEWVAGAMIVLVGTAALIAVLLVSRAHGSFQDPARFRVLFRDGHGVAQGSRVQMLGVDVGRVESVEITDANMVEVRLAVRPAFAAKVRADSQARLEASLGLQGVLAGVGIAITPGSAAARSLGADETIVAIEPEHIADLLPGVADPLVEDLEVLANNLRALSDEALDPESDLRILAESLAAVAGRIEAGEGTAGKLLGDDAVLYERLINTLDDLDRTMRRIDGAVGRSDKLVRRSSEVMGSAAQVVQNADALVDSADAMVSSAQGVLEKTDPVLEHTDDAMGDLKGAIGKFSDATEDLTEVATRLQALIDQMEVVTEAAGRVFPIRRQVRKLRRERKK